MTAKLVQQAHDIRLQSAALLARAEKLLTELREMTYIIPPSKAEEYIPKKHGRRIILELR